MTGGARGIGRAIALALAAAGRAVAVGDLRAQEAAAVVGEIEGAGGGAAAIELDVTDSGSVAAAVEGATAQLGPIDVLVNNAGWDELHPFLETDEDFWRRVVEVNYLGCVRVTHAVLGGMVERGWGRIVSLGSDAGRVGSSQEAVYSGAKGGIIAFTKTVAREAARAGVTANSVCPGPTDTPMLRQMAGEGPEGEKLIGSLQRAVPMRRLGQPEEVAAAVAFLASDRAGFITGQTLSVSGGLTMA